jgi:hypothetical protein
MEALAICLRLSDVRQEGGQTEGTAFLFSTCPLLPAVFCFFPFNSLPFFFVIKQQLEALEESAQVSNSTLSKVNSHIYPAI